MVPGTGNARWRESPFWPLYLSYLILYVDPDYQTALVGYPGPRLRLGVRAQAGNRRRHLPIAARTDEDQGYDISLFRRVPQTPEQIGNPGFQ